jgi:hypothetical protein
MITGVHAIIYTKDPDAVRAFLRDVLAFPPSAHPLRHHRCGGARILPQAGAPD